MSPLYLIYFFKVGISLWREHGRQDDEDAPSIPVLDRSDVLEVEYYEQGSYFSFIVSDGDIAILMMIVTVTDPNFNNSTSSAENRVMPSTTLYGSVLDDTQMICFFPRKQ